MNDKKCNNEKCVLNKTCNTYTDNKKEKNVVTIYPYLRKGGMFKNYICSYYVNKNELIGQGKI